jgi:hypothetical protein
MASFLGVSLLLAFTSKHNARTITALQSAVDPDLIFPTDFASLLALTSSVFHNIRSLVVLAL